MTPALAEDAPISPTETDAPSAGGPSKRHATRVSTSRRAGTRRAKPGDLWLGVGLVVAAGFGFGLQNVLAKIAYDGGADVATVLAVRFGVAAFAVTALYRLRGVARVSDAEGSLTARRGLGIVALGLLYVGNALFAYLALARLPASTTTLLVFAFPGLVVLWSRLFFGDPITGRKLLALALALGGCALTVDIVGSGASARLDWVGIGWAAASALTNSWYATLAGPVGKGLSGVTVAAGSLPVTAVCFAAALAVRGGPSLQISTTGWLACLAIGLLAGLSITAFLAGIPLIGPSRAAIAATSEPAAAVALAALLLGEAVAPTTLVGGLGILAALVLLATGRRRAPSPGG